MLQAPARQQSCWCCFRCAPAAFEQPRALGRSSSGRPRLWTCLRGMPARTPAGCVAASCWLGLLPAAVQVGKWKGGPSAGVVLPRASLDASLAFPSDQATAVDGSSACSGPSEAPSGAAEVQMYSAIVARCRRILSVRYMHEQFLCPTKPKIVLILRRQPCSSPRPYCIARSGYPEWSFYRQRASAWMAG